MSFRPIAVANFLIDLAEGARQPVTPMKLQKLVYFAHGWHLAFTDLPLIDESVEAWKWGPVIPSLWGELKDYGNKPIDKKISQVAEAKMASGKLTFKLVYPSVADDETSVGATVAQAVLRKIWGVYGGLSAIQLSNMTHQPGTPWHQIWMPMAANPIKRKDIPNEIIRDFFRDQLNRES